MSDELWKPIPKFEDIYEISNHGRLRRIKSTTASSKIRILKGSKNSDGYMTVFLWRDGKAIQKYVHRLVLESFFQKANAPVNHKDGIKSNNHVLNLEYCTVAENNLHAYKIGLKKGSRRKLTEYMITEMRLLKPMMSYKKLAERYNVHIGTIIQVFSGRTWKC